MLKIEEYIAKRKKEDNLDEFIFKNHAHNLATCVRYVTDYYNDYLNYETFNDEYYKMEQIILKIDKELGNDFPLSKDFIINFYRAQKVRIDRIIKNHLKNTEFRFLYSTNEDFGIEIERIIDSKQHTNLELSVYKKELTIIAKELTLKELENPDIEVLNRLDPNISKWIKDTYKNFDVNLLAFANAVAESYHDKFNEYASDRNWDRGYSINKYNYRYIDNPFNIDAIYDKNSSSPFLDGKKGELEMIIMNVWLYEWIEDYGYWSEYVNLCVNTGRVKLATNINVLYPVLYKNVEYPPDISTKMEYIETADGTPKEAIINRYVIAIVYKNDKDTFWKDWEMFNEVCDNLNQTIKKYGNPYAIELMSPIREVSYNEDNFIAFYKEFERKFGKLRGTKITIVNGVRKTRTSAKKIAMFQSPEEIVKLCEIITGLKLKLKITLSVKNILGNKGRYQDQVNLIPLLEKKYYFEGLHLAAPFGVNEINSRSDSNNHYHLSSFGFTNIPGTLDVVMQLMSDQKLHYMVPHGIEDEVYLEELCDDLLRGGFSFYKEET